MHTGLMSSWWDETMFLKCIHFVAPTYFSRPEQRLRSSAFAFCGYSHSILVPGLHLSSDRLRWFVKERFTPALISEDTHVLGHPATLRHFAWFLVPFINIRTYLLTFCTWDVLWREHVLTVVAVLTQLSGKRMKWWSSASAAQVTSSFSHRCLSSFLLNASHVVINLLSWQRTGARSGDEQMRREMSDPLRSRRFTCAYILNLCRCASYWRCLYLWFAGRQLGGAARRGTFPQQVRPTAADVNSRSASLRDRGCRDLDVLCNWSMGPA